MASCSTLPKEQLIQLFLGAVKAKKKQWAKSQSLGLCKRPLTRVSVKDRGKKLAFFLRLPLKDSLQQRLKKGELGTIFLRFLPTLWCEILEGFVPESPGLLLDLIVMHIPTFFPSLSHSPVRYIHPRLTRQTGGRIWQRSSGQTYLIVLYKACELTLNDKLVWRTSPLRARFKLF